MQDVKLEALHPTWKEVRLPFSDVVRSFVSGDPAGDRIRVRYFQTEIPQVLKGRVWFGPGAEGPPGHTHGGAQAAVLDEICGGAVWVSGFRVVAAKLETEFLNFVPLETELVLHGEIVKQEGRKIYSEGRLEDLSGRLLARGKVLFLELNAEQVKKLAKVIGDLELPTEALPPR